MRTKDGGLNKRKWREGGGGRGEEGEKGKLMEGGMERKGGQRIGKEGGRKGECVEKEGT